MSIFEQLVGGCKIPELIPVRQKFPRPVLKDPVSALRKEILESKLLERVPRGSRVAITAGSRGIANLDLITRELVNILSEAGAEPFIFPAMGSHGGATGAGQEEVLRSYGLSEEKLGVPIKSSMDVVKLGYTDDYIPVYVDHKAVTEADAIIVVNRIKPHTTFRGTYESGLAKMLAIGMGKQQGAEICHSTGPLNMSGRIESIARMIIEKTNIAFGIGILENAYDETCKLAVLAPEDILDQEPVLLEEARELMAQIYFKNYDVLVVDEIGKNISGTGMDPNIVGRYTTDTIKNENWMQRIVVLDLTGQTYGNANGIGLADICSKKAFEKINFEKTYPNCLTTRVVLSAKIPVVMNSDRQAIQAAIKTCFDLDLNKVRLVRIKNTLQLEQISISEALLTEALAHPMLDVPEQKARPLLFDSRGNILE